MSRPFRRTTFAFALAFASAAHGAAQTPDESWSTYGGNLAGQRYSALSQIDASNVAELAPAWTFHTGTFRKAGAQNKRAAFEANPILWNRALFFDTPFDEVFAVNAVTGEKLWSYDPGIDRNVQRSLVTSRGVALWHDAKETADCSHRVFVATLDGRLLALDAVSGRPCTGFGNAGVVDLKEGVNLRSNDDYGETSPPTVVGDVVIVGSSIGDNRAVEEESGVVRAYDARTGRKLWSWDPIAWAATMKPRTGGGNAWTAFAADAEHGLVYIPTGSPSPDFWGGFRKGNNQDANSIVALDVHTGRKVWAFQVVHHDLWDYDIAAQPTLFTFHPAGGGAPVPAIVVATKMGSLFVFNRLNGVPLFPIHEQAVPQTTVPGEWTSPTQPMSSLPPLAPLTLAPNDISARTPEDQQACRDKLASLNYRGIFTPVTTEKDTLLYPGSVGGVNWGSVAVDPAQGILYANVNRLAYLIRLVPQETLLDRIEAHVDKWTGSGRTEAPPSKGKFNAPDTGGDELSLQAGAPYRISRIPFLAPSGLPCTPQPWGLSVAFDLNHGKLLWQRPLGTMEPGKQTGSPTLGGPVVTAGGVLFTAATVDPHLRAFDVRDGRLLWQAELPAPAQATPMTYSLDGRQYVVIAAGGHGSVGLAQSDAVLAFALPLTKHHAGHKAGASR